MAYQLVTPPEDEPLSLTETKTHLRVDSVLTEDDSLITALIAAARQYVEQKTGSSLVTQTWKYTMDCFPGSGCILLHKGPHRSVDSIGYLDMAGAARTLDPADYVADLTGPLTRITPRFSKAWPATLPQIASAWVQFTAGYGDAEDVPQGIKQWMLVRIGSLYENREELAGRTVSIAALPFIDSLLDPYTVWTA